MDLKKSDQVADFACGNGALLDHVCPLVRSYTGVDFSETMIEYATARMNRLGLTNARFECARIEEFCARHARVFDAGFALDFSEHVYDDSWVAILRSIRQALKRPGRLYLHTPNADFLLERMRRGNVLLRQSPEHVAVRTLAENTRLLEEAGFRISRGLLIPHYNILRVIHPLSFIPVVGRYLKARIFIEALA